MVLRMPPSDRKFGELLRSAVQWPRPNGEILPHGRPYWDGHSVWSASCSCSSTIEAKNTSFPTLGFSCDFPVTYSVSSHSTAVGTVSTVSASVPGASDYGGPSGS